MRRIFAAVKRIPPRALILTCVAVAAAVTFISVSVYEGGSDAAAQAAESEASREPAFEMAAAPDTEPAVAGPSEQTDPPQESPEPTETGPLGGVVFKEGMSDPVIASVQQRLMDLNYMDDAQPTELYGPLTGRAIMSFQRQAGLPTDGFMEEKTYTMLMDPDAPTYAVDLGAQGPDVVDMVYCLYEMGYMDTAPEIYTEAVKTAVANFQEMNGLDVDGIIGGETRGMLYSDKAKDYDYAPDDEGGDGDEGGAANLTISATQESNLSPDRLEAVLPSALSGLGQALRDGEQRYGINSLFVLAIINYESGYGTSSLAQGQNNLGGLKADGSYKTFSSKAECVDSMYNLLSENYVGRGLVTIDAIGEVYCGGTWAATVKGYMQELIAQLS
jgi:peptidoglycan hydrolase-like protein with peptidoglycan-binding domain